jgi:hypothetical protein
MTNDGLRGIQLSTNKNVRSGDKTLNHVLRPPFGIACFELNPFGIALLKIA